MKVGIKYDYTVGEQGTILASDITQIKNELENLRTFLTLSGPSTFANASHRILNGFVPTTSYSDNIFTITMDNIGFDLNDKIEVTAPTDMLKDSTININGVDYGILPYDVTSGDTLNLIKTTGNTVSLDLHIDLSDIGQQIQSLIGSLDIVLQDVNIIEGEQYIGALEQEKLDLLTQLKSDYNTILQNFTIDVNKNVEDYLNFQEVFDKDTTLTSTRNSDPFTTYQTTLSTYQALKDRLTALSSKVDKVNALIDNKATFTTNPDNELNDLINPTVNDLHTSMTDNETDLNEMQSVINILDNVEQKILVDLTEVVPDVEVMAYPFITTPLPTTDVTYSLVSPFTNDEGTETTFTFENGLAFTTSLGFNPGDTLTITYDSLKGTTTLLSVLTHRLGDDARDILLALLELRAFRSNLVSHKNNAETTVANMQTNLRSSEVVGLNERYKYVTRDLKTFALEDVVLDKLLTEIEGLDTNAADVESTFDQDVKNKFIESIDFIDVNARLTMNCIGKEVVDGNYTDGGYDAGGITGLTDFSQAFSLLANINDLKTSDVVQTQDKYNNLVTYLAKNESFGTDALKPNKIDCVSKKIINDRYAIITDASNELYNAWNTLRYQPNRNSLLKRPPITNAIEISTALTSTPLPFISTEFYKLFRCQGLLVARKSSTGEYTSISQMNQSLNVDSGDVEIFSYMDTILQPSHDVEANTWTFGISNVENGSLFTPITENYGIPPLAASDTTKFFSSNSRVFAINDSYWYYTKNDPVTGEIVWIETNEAPQYTDGVHVDFLVNVVGERVELYENEEMYYKGVKTTGVKMIHSDGYSIIVNGALTIKRYTDMLDVTDTSTFEPNEIDVSYLGGLTGTDYTTPALTMVSSYSVVKAYNEYNY